jgi:hypothetical protein
MLNTPTHSNIQRYRLDQHAAELELEEKLPISDDARFGLASLRIGLIGALAVAVIIIAAKIITA